MDLTVYVEFPNSTCNQLGVLRTVVYDEDGFLHCAGKNMLNALLLGNRISPN